MSEKSRAVDLDALPTSMLHDMATGLVEELRRGRARDSAAVPLDAIVDELAERATKGEKPRPVEA